jgi:hypothetical protein
VTEKAARRTAQFHAVEFRSIGDLAVRCGHYCWLESQLFALTGRWASAPVMRAGNTVDPEIRVLCSQMSSWHGFMARQWLDRLPVRAGVDAGALVVPSPGGVGQAIELLGAEADVLVALGGLVEPFLPALLAAYDDDEARASPVSELPVLAVLELARHRAPREIEAGRNFLDRGAEAGAAAERAAGLRARLQRMLGVNRGIFPAARAS